MSYSPQPGAEATLRQLRNEAAAVLLGRLITVTQLAAAAATVRPKVRHPKALLAGISAIAGQSAWAGTRVWRTRRVRDRAAGWSDVLAGTSALAIEAASWGTRDLPPDPRWSLPFGVVVSAWLPFELEPAELSAAGAAWLTAYVAAIRSRSAFRAAGAVRGQWTTELLAPPACTFFSRRFATQLRRQAGQLDRARAEAVQRADLLAREEERNRQHRVTHDSAIQVLEAVAGGWDVDQQVLSKRIEFEIRRLRRVLAGGSLAEGDSLAEGLRSLAAEFHPFGLTVTADLAQLHRSPEPAVVTALCEAAREALVNVGKHAGVEHAQIIAANAEGTDGVTVSVIDAGDGFDVDAPRCGYGLGESILGRIQAVGGRAEIRSTPGEGTTVRLWAPA
jgi:signal transduction histidine kinase